MDSTTFLGAGALQVRRLREGGCAHAPRRFRCAGDQKTDPALYSIVTACIPGSLVDRDGEHRLGRTYHRYGAFVYYVGGKGVARRLLPCATPDVPLFAALPICPVRGTDRRQCRLPGDCRVTVMAKRVSDMHKKRRGRNIALVVVVFALAALFYVMSIVRMSGGGAG